MRVNLEKKEERERIAASLLRATLELAATHGFSSLGLREVSRAAGLAPTSFYRHFADMEELGIALIDGLVGQLVRDVSNLDPSPESNVAVETIANRIFAAAVRDPGLLRFILAERMGAIASFRKALDQQLAVIAHALLQVAGGSADEASSRRSEGAGAVVVLLLDACGQILDGGGERLTLLRQRLMAEAELLLGLPSDPKARS